MIDTNQYKNQDKDNTPRLDRSKQHPESTKINYLEIYNNQKYYDKIKV